MCSRSDRVNLAAQNHPVSRIPRSVCLEAISLKWAPHRRTIPCRRRSVLE